MEKNKAELEKLEAELKIHENKASTWKEKKILGFGTSAKDMGDIFNKFAKKFHEFSQIAKYRAIAKHVTKGPLNSTKKAKKELVILKIQSKHATTHSNHLINHVKTAKKS